MRVGMLRVCTLVLFIIIIYYSIKSVGGQLLLLFIQLKLWVGGYYYYYYSIKSMGGQLLLLFIIQLKLWAGSYYYYLLFN